MTAIPLPSRVSAVIFDMDGTLHDTEIIYLAATKHAAATLGFTITDAFCHSLIGIPGRESDAMLRAHLGPSFPFDAFDQLYHAYIDDALRIHIPLKPGVPEALEAFIGLGLKLAVATSATRRSAEPQLTLSGLRPHLPVVVTRDDVARGKPYPDLFLHAAALLDVPASACLAIEDSLNGVRAAHAAGMMPVMVPDLLMPTEEIRAMCVHVASDLHEVRILITAR